MSGASDRSRMVAILLGASSWPKSADRWPTSKAFSKSAKGFKAYLSNQNEGLGIDSTNILNLFNDRAEASKIDEKIELFLRAAELRFGQHIEDLVLYYVGHGAFTEDDRKYCLALKSTRISNRAASAYRMSALARTINSCARRARKFVIIDACYAAAAGPDWLAQSDAASRMEDEAAELVPSGVALLCAASSVDVALARENFTMFSGALLSSLRTGSSYAGAKLSFDDLRDLIDKSIRDQHQDEAVRPEVHIPDQRRGDLSEHGLFPNRCFDPLKFKGKSNTVSQRRLEAMTFRIAFFQLTNFIIHQVLHPVSLVSLPIILWIFMLKYWHIYDWYLIQEEIPKVGIVFAFLPILFSLAAVLIAHLIRIPREFYKFKIAYVLSALWTTLPFFAMFYKIDDINLGAILVNGLYYALTLNALFYCIRIIKMKSLKSYDVWLSFSLMASVLVIMSDFEFMITLILGRWDSVAFEIFLVGFGVILIFVFKMLGGSLRSHMFPVALYTVFFSGVVALALEVIVSYIPIQMLPSANFVGWDWPNILGGIVFIMFILSMLYALKRLSYIKLTIVGTFLAPIYDFWGRHTDVFNFRGGRFDTFHLILIFVAAGFALLLPLFEKRFYPPQDPLRLLS